MQWQNTNATAHIRHHVALLSDEWSGKGGVVDAVGVMAVRDVMDVVGVGDAVVV